MFLSLSYILKQMDEKYLSLKSRKYVCLVKIRYCIDTQFGKYDKIDFWQKTLAVANDGFVKVARFLVVKIVLHPLLRVVLKIDDKGK